MPWDAASLRKDPFWALLCGSESQQFQQIKECYPLSSVQVNPASQVRMGTVSWTVFAGRKMLKWASKPPRAADYTRVKICEVNLEPENRP